MTPKRKTGSLNREKREIEEREQKLREEESIRQGILEAETYYKQCEEKEKELSEVIAAEQKKQEKLSKAMDCLSDSYSVRASSIDCSAASSGISCPNRCLTEDTSAFSSPVN